MMLKILHLFYLLLFAYSVPVAAQIQLKLQLLDNDLTWGVYATTDQEITANSLTGSGQVTVVMPKGYLWSELKSHAGLWQEDANVVDPVENPAAQYVSIGLVTAEPSFPIRYIKGGHTLLFTFKGGGDCPEFLRLIDCGTPNSSDPFCPNSNPNSQNSNPTNDLSVIDFGSSSSLNIFSFSDLYAPAAWDCHDNDGDGIPNAIEDTNGNGVYDPGIDASDLNVKNFTPGPGPSKGVAISSHIAVDSMVANPNKNAAAFEAFSLFSNDKNNLTLTLSPNPAREVLFIDFEKELPPPGSSLWVLDLQGRVLQKTAIGEMAQAKLDVSGLQPGLYIVALENGGLFSERRKFVKQ